MSSEKTLFKLNAMALDAALENLEFKKLHDFFSDAIMQSLEVIRRETKSQLGSAVPALAKYGDTIQAEVAMSGDEGRVKLIKGKEPNYKCAGEPPYFLLHFFEKGTKIRKKKTDGYHWEVAKGGAQNGNRRHRNRSNSTTGRIQPKNFLSKAVASKEKEAYRKLEEILNNKFGKIFHN